MKHLWTCLNEDCEKETEVTVIPYVPARTYGAPENCHPSEGGEIEPTECPHCGQKFPEDEIYEAACVDAEESEQCAREDYYDALRDENF